MNEYTRIFSYKMTHDTGFAPNPFNGILTLACCKPGIRRTKQIGDWIAGFTSKILIKNYNRHQKQNKCADFKWFEEEELIYLMQVKQKLTYEEYWNSREFQNKKPNSSCLIAKTGDNIYFPDSQMPSAFGQLKNHNHKPDSLAHDLSGQYILVSSTFYYFGINSLQLNPTISPKLPKTQSAYGIRTHDELQIKRFIKYIQSNYAIGIHGHPHTWERDDSTWRQHASDIK